MLLSFRVAVGFRHSHMPLHPQHFSPPLCVLGAGWHPASAWGIDSQNAFGASQQSNLSGESQVKWKVKPGLAFSASERWAQRDSWWCDDAEGPEMVWANGQVVFLCVSGPWQDGLSNTQNASWACLRGKKRTLFSCRGNTKWLWPNLLSLLKLSAEIQYRTGDGCTRASFHAAFPQQQRNPAPGSFVLI